MGSYTTNLKFYKPDSTEFVDVQTQLNDNWDIADAALKELLDYEYTDLQTPNIIGLNKAKFYKSYSNSVMMYFRSGNFFYQDPTSFVSTWVPVTVNSPYSAHPDYPIAYRVIKLATSPTTTEIEWTGAFWLGGGPLPLNTNVTNVITIPSAAIPTTGKYFQVNAGNTSTDFSFARVGFFPGTNDVQYKRYGQNPSSGTSDENRVEIGGLSYNIEVTG